ncbi:hypothetical protein H097_09582 [Pseudomonas sp. FH4]|nr:hypothetical protein H097_09582 [Pseudomonas sp. FH4]
MCRKNDPFSPQARWGDDGARRMCVSETPKMNSAYIYFLMRINIIIGAILVFLVNATVGIAMADSHSEGDLDLA